MTVKIYKRTTAGRRNMSIVKPEGVVSVAPHKSLLRSLNKKSGRSNGKISVRHRGGGHKRRYRVVDFVQNKHGIPGRIETLERDPNRSALIALVCYADGERRYVLATAQMAVGQSILSKEDAPIVSGNRLKLKNVPSGTVVSSIELVPGKGGQIVRSAGSGATVMGNDGTYTQVRLASGEVRLIHDACWATVGVVSNFEHGTQRLGKAGRARWLGRRPSVRGSAMNPVDHPHGGGEGAQGIGLKYPKTPWGKPALGRRTRSVSRPSSRFILSRRKNKRRK
ncbi:MAG: 50S ribosomal protein L2 [Candidatus Moranbacteria bacterium]|nr:50S ribosomal protein L2 [Candidatus Moranbacteria bacterium]